MQLKWPKFQKPKDESMGWTKHILSKLQSLYFVEFALSSLNFYDSDLHTIIIEVEICHFTSRVYLSFEIKYFLSGKLWLIAKFDNVLPKSTI